MSAKQRGIVRSKYAGEGGKQAFKTRRRCRPRFLLKLSPRLEGSIKNVLGIRTASNKSKQK